jgi:hypothetical protein
MLPHAEQGRFTRELNKLGGDVPSNGRNFSPQRHTSKSACKKELTRFRGLSVGSGGL